MFHGVVVMVPGATSVVVDMVVVAATGEEALTVVVLTVGALKEDIGALDDRSEFHRKTVSRCRVSTTLKTHVFAVGEKATFERETNETFGSASKIAICWVTSADVFAIPASVT